MFEKLQLEDLTLQSLDVLYMLSYAAEPGDEQLRDPGADRLLLPHSCPPPHHPPLPTLTNPVS